MNTTRAQKIYNILSQNYGRLDIHSIYLEILRLEDLSPHNLVIHSIGATCRSYNHTCLKKTGKKLFRLYPEEQRGYISLYNSADHTISSKYDTKQLEYFLTTVLELFIQN